MHAKYFKIIALAALILTLSACAKRPVKDDTSWKNEIAEGHSCGEEKFSCCTDREPKCFYGLICCSDPNNANNTVCAKECKCGKEGDFCCADSKGSAGSPQADSCALRDWIDRVVRIRKIHGRRVRQADSTGSRQAHDRPVRRNQQIYYNRLEYAKKGLPARTDTA